MDYYPYHIACIYEITGQHWMHKFVNVTNEEIPNFCNWLVVEHPNEYKKVTVPHGEWLSTTHATVGQTINHMMEWRGKK